MILNKIGCFFLFLYLNVSTSLCNESDQAEVLLKPYKQVVFSAPVSGILLSSFVNPGDEVSSGSILGKLDAREEQFEVSRLEKMVKKKEFDSKGFQNLLKDDMASKVEAMQAGLEKEITKLELNRAVMRLDRMTVTSNMDGTVVDRFHEPGEWVGLGEPLFEVVDVSRLKGIALLDEEQVKSFLARKTLTVNMKSIIRDCGEQEYSATPLFIAPGFDLSSGLKKIEVLISNENGCIQPGMRGTLKFTH
jgi:RND family efflux transporter MFP subunit